jgi:DNA-binding response OmpR family regulator
MDSQKRRIRQTTVSAPISILHVEDDPNDVLLVQRAFRKSHSTVLVHHVCDGEIATHYLLGDEGFSDREQFPLPNLLLLDLKLPRRTGLEVLAWLRSQKSPLNRLPVVVLTSSSQPVDVNRAYELGANAYMVKPTGFEELFNAIKMLNQYWFVLSEKPELQLVS